MELSFPHLFIVLIFQSVSFGLDNIKWDISCSDIGQMRANVRQASERTSMCERSGVRAMSMECGRMYTLYTLSFGFMSLANQK